VLGGLIVSITSMPRELESYKCVVVPVGVSLYRSEERDGGKLFFFLQRFVIDFSYNMTCILAGSLALYLSLTPKSVCLFTVADSSRPVPDERINRMHFLFFLHLILLLLHKEKRLRSVGYTSRTQRDE